jgi:hypothetical protein
MHCYLLFERLMTMHFTWILDPIMQDGPFCLRNWKQNGPKHWKDEKNGKMIRDLRFEIRDSRIKSKAVPHAP